MLPRSRAGHAATTVTGRVLVGCDGCGAVGIARGSSDPVVPLVIHQPAGVELVHEPGCDGGIVWSGDPATWFEWIAATRPQVEVATR